MRNFALKVPTALIIALVLLPLMIFVLQKISGDELIKPEYYGVLSILGSIVKWIWVVSIVDYFYSKAPDFKYVRWIYLLLILDFAFILFNAFGSNEFSLTEDLVLFVAHLAVWISATVFITLLIRTVFYERAVWFIVLELLITIVGITTLTPEIKRNEKELQGQI